MLIWTGCLFYGQLVLTYSSTYRRKVTKRHSYRLSIFSRFSFKFCTNYITHGHPDDSHPTLNFRLWTPRWIAEEDAFFNYAFHRMNFILFIHSLIIAAYGESSEDLRWSPSGRTSSDSFVVGDVSCVPDDNFVICSSSRPFCYSSRDVRLNWSLVFGIVSGRHFKRRSTARRCWI